MTQRLRSAWTIAGLLALAPTLFAQTPAIPRRTAVITGRVVEGLSDRGVAGATVTVQSRRPAAGFRVLSALDGSFEIRELPAGEYLAGATAAGYLPSYATGARPEEVGAVFTLADAGRASVVIRMWRPAVIAGQVFDETGEPMEGVPVVALPAQPGDGSGAIGASVTTDDRGRYRISTPAGTYRICAMFTRSSLSTAAAAAANARGQVADALRSGAPDAGISGFRIGDVVLGAPPGLHPGVVGESGGRHLVYADACHAGASTVDSAAPLDVTQGQEIAGIDLHLRPLPAVSVSGIVVGPAGPMPMVGVHLLRAGATGGIRPAASALTDPAGAFTFAGVPPGEHVIQVVLGPGSLIWTLSHANSRVDEPPQSIALTMGAPVFWASQPVTAGDRDVDGLLLSLREAGPVGGRIEFRGSLPPVSGAEIAGTLVRFQLVDGIAAAEYVQPVGGFGRDGNLHSTGILPGRYFVHVSRPPPGWTLESIMISGRDASDEPVELGTTEIDDVRVVMTDRPGVFGGTVRTPAGNPDAAAAVIVFPAERERWQPPHPRRLHRVPTAADGSFRILGLPGGTYFCVAIHAADPLAWRAPRTLERLAGVATRVVLRAQEHRDVALTTTRPAR